MNNINLSNNKVEDILVSVAMVTYYHEKYIRQALDSILMQNTAFRYEVVIGDDCSGDNTKSILEDYQKKYPNLIKLILRDENIGANNNLVDVYSKCRGKYIAILEGDDYWCDPNKLQNQVQFLEENQNFIAVCSGFRAINSKEEFLYKKNIKKDYHSILDYFEERNAVIMILSLMFRNIFLEEKNLEAYKLLIKNCRVVGDRQMKTFLLSKGSIRCTDSITAVYRYKSNPYSWSSVTDIERKLNERIVVWENIRTFLKGNHDSIINKKIDYLHSQNLYIYIKRGKLIRSLTSLKKIKKKSNLIQYFYDKL
jgi:glycosyltransferase involved in cell wall biosynthesis